jgi:hypothetical protein
MCFGGGSGQITFEIPILHRDVSYGVLYDKAYYTNTPYDTSLILRNLPDLAGISHNFGVILLLILFWYIHVRYMMHDAFTHVHTQTFAHAHRLVGNEGRCTAGWFGNEVEHVCKGHGLL